MPTNRPTIMRILITAPKTLKIFTQTRGILSSPTVRRTEKITSGTTLTARSVRGILSMSPETMHPAGTAAIPHMSPRMTLSLFSGAVTPKDRGREKEMVAPIIEPTTRPLK